MLDKTIPYNLIPKIVKLTQTDLFAFNCYKLIYLICLVIVCGTEKKFRGKTTGRSKKQISLVLHLFH